MTARSTAIVFAIAFTMIVPAGIFLGMFGSSEASPGSTVLRMGFAEPIDSLNPYMGMNDVSQVFYSLVYDSLTGVGGNMSAVPCLAQEWRIVPDELPYGSVWEYNLSAGAEWSDGVPVTAEDIAWNINLNCDPANYAMMWAFQPYSFYMEYAEVIDVDTVRIHFWDRALLTPLPVAFGDSILIPMLPKHMLQSLSPPEIAFLWTGDPVVGSGPFIPSPTLYDDWMAGEAITLLRNPDYHGGPNYGRYVQFDKIEFHFYDDADALSLALENNELDIAGLPLEQFHDLKDRIYLGSVEDIETTGGLRPDGYWENVAINMNDAGPNPSRLDPVIRQAMAMATNRSGILNQFYHGEGMEGSTLISPLSEWHYHLGVGEELAYDPISAKAMLDAAGYYDIDFDGIRECNATSWAVLQGYVSAGEELRYQMLARTEHPEEGGIASYLETDWAGIGIDLEWYVVDETTLSMNMYAYNYDTVIWHWGMDPDPNYIQFAQSNRSWNAWSDNLYSSPDFEENYTASLMEMDSSARGIFVDNCQKVHYLDSAYIMFAYLNDTYAWRTDTFSGWGDWSSEPGRSVTAAWSGNPLYFELVPLVEYNSNPEEVTLEAHPVFGDTSTPIGFTASAMDADGDNLSFCIDFGDGTPYDCLLSSAPMYSVHEVNFSHTYASEGVYLATVYVDDGSGLPGANVTAHATVTIFQEGQRRVSYEWYDLFNVSTGEWWDIRSSTYGNVDPLTYAYPYLYQVELGIPGDVEYMTSMRLDITGQNMSEINMDSRPLFLPFLGSERGGNVSIDWYMQYLTTDEAARYPAPVQGSMDGWTNVLNGTVTLDAQASKAVMNLTDADFEDFSGWWANNSATFNSSYRDWLAYEGNDRLDIFPAYDWPLTFMFFSIEAEKVGETIVLTYDIVSWGQEILMARWLRDAFMPTEWTYEDFRLAATISSTSADLDVSTAVEFAATAWETTLLPDGGTYGQPCWVWAGQLADYLPSTVLHPFSDFNPYDGLDTMTRSPASDFWHSYVPFHETPAAWNLSAAETLSFEWPSGDLLFYEDDPWSSVPIEVSGPMTVLYSEPLEWDMPAQIANSQAARTLSFTGPFDMWTWSHDQMMHENLASEWDRLGMLPYGMPWIEFQIDSGLNTPPTALFEHTPEFGDVTTLYGFDAADSWDLEDGQSSLEFRWDWNGDGTYDTGWSTSAIAVHQFTTAGTYDVTLQVMDSQGATDTKVVQIEVVEIIPEFPTLVMPIFAVALLVMLFRSRRRR